jgi:hypothetical protein
MERPHAQLAALLGVLTKQESSTLVPVDVRVKV